ncbi:MAG: ATP-dependent 6-phosphofructokinase [Alphaproteobacteria bacterium]
MTKRIGILTSGGDCAGLNAVIRGVVYRAIQGYGWEVIGIKQGTHGLISRPVNYQKLELDQFDGNVLRMGGTILGTTNKGDPFAFPMPDGTLKDMSDEIIAGAKEIGLDALIGVGGDGSLEVLSKLVKKGDIPFIGIPKTIDNDIGITERSIGFSTAVEVATEALDRLQPTAASHDRVMILEVMGRDAGHIAIEAGIAGGADVVLVPEIPYKLENIRKKVQSLFDRGRNFALVVVAEATKTESGEPVTANKDGERYRYGGIGHYLADKIADITGADTRCTVLGHVQRGGQPDANDRVLASALGVHAVDLIAENKFDRMVAWQKRNVTDVPLAEAVATYQAVDPNGVMVRTARGLGICLGDG